MGKRVFWVKWADGTEMSVLATGLCAAIGVAEDIRPEREMVSVSLIELPEPVGAKS